MGELQGAIECDALAVRGDRHNPHELIFDTYRCDTRDEELVSKDFNGNAHSCIFDATLTAVIDKRFVKAFGWYDNEWGYSNRVVDLIAYVAKQGLGSTSSRGAQAAVGA